MMHYVEQAFHAQMCALMNAVLHLFG